MAPPKGSIPCAHPMFGKKHSADAIAKMSAAKKGKPRLDKPLSITAALIRGEMKRRRVRKNLENGPKTKRRYTDDGSAANVCNV